jgi:hypothetical protein
MGTCDGHLRFGVSRRFGVPGPLALACGALSALAQTSTAGVSVHVQKRPLAGSVHISFKPAGQLPAGGYYYAVMVLGPYRHYTLTATVRDLEQFGKGRLRLPAGRSARGARADPDKVRERSLVSWRHLHRRYLCGAPGATLRKRVSLPQRII